MLAKEAIALLYQTASYYGLGWCQELKISLDTPAL